MGTTNRKRMAKIRPIRAFAVIKNGKLDAFEIYKDTDVVLTKGETIVSVIISVDENKTRQKRHPVLNNDKRKR